MRGAAEWFAKLSAYSPPCSLPTPHFMKQHSHLSCSLWRSLVTPPFAADALRVVVASDASAAGKKLESELVATLNEHGAKATVAA